MKKIPISLISFFIGISIVSADTKKINNKYVSIRKKTPFVLVHGAWHGGWCWKKLTPHLTRAGNTVYTPTLTGLGERSHLLNDNINLDTHIQDIVSMIEFENLNDITLVGHSYAGFVIAGVAEKVPERISAIVFLDALIPDDGKAVLDFLSESAKNIYYESMKNNDKSWKLLFSQKVDISELGIFSKKDAEWIESRMTEQPHNTYSQKISISESTAKLINEKGFFILTSDRQDFIAEYKRASERGLKLFKIDGAGHNSMITQPEKLAYILLNLKTAKKAAGKIKN